MYCSLSLEEKDEMTLRLAIIGGFLDVKGGSERFTLEVAKRFPNRGVEVKIFCHRYNSDEGYDGFRDVPIESINARTDLLGRFRAYFFLKNMRQLVLRADNWGADIIFLQIGCIFSNYLKKLTRKSVISYIHNQEGFGVRNENRLRDFYRSVLGLSDERVLGMDEVPIICNSCHTAQLVRHRYSNVNSVFIVYPGADLDRFRPTWEDRGYLYYHSRYVSSKNQKFAVDIASHIKYPVILTGSLDAKLSRHYYDELIANKSSNVTILANVSDEEALSYLQNCSIFLFPSISEHFGMAMVEAMACGKPVIGHNSGAAPEVVFNGGYLCGDDLNEWVEKINRLMTDGQLRKELGERSYELAKRFSWDHTVEALEKVFYSCL